MKKSKRPRIVWIDWMKSIGMLCIIWGHCFPEGLSAFIYAFNVPVFFLVSGYLAHQEPTMKRCFDKVLHNLIIPYLILGFIKVAGYMIPHITDGQALWSVIAILGGFHSLHDAAGCSNLWFVYTLIIIRLLYQWQPNRRLLLSLVAIAGALVYNYLGLEWKWSVTNVMLALPFFMLGNRLSQLRGIYDYQRYLTNIGILAMLPSMYLFIIITFIASWVNGSADMYECQYGNNPLLFALGAIFGSLTIWLISTFLQDADSRALRITSMGTIVTLVFHRELLHPLLKWIGQQDFNIVTANLLMFLSSVLVLLAFIPIILIVKRFFPIVLGQRTKNV